MRVNANNKFHYFYKITNNINGHYYYGVHNTCNLNDGYMGSGTRLHIAYKKYGIENFSKEILKFFDTAQEAFEYESEVVNETLVKDINCYNIKLGGDGWLTIGLATVKDKDGNTFDVPVDDERLLSGELVGVTKGVIPKHLFIKGHHIAYDKNGNYLGLFSTDDIRWKTGEFNIHNKGLILCKHKYKELFKMLYKDDPEYNVLYIPLWKNKKHSLDTIYKIKESLKNINHLKGEKNSQYGTCWVYKYTDTDIINKKIKKDELPIYIDNGWIKGRKMK